VEVRVDQPGNDRTAATINDPIPRLRVPADLHDHARRHPDAPFPQLRRHAVGNTVKIDAGSGFEFRSATNANVIVRSPTRLLPCPT
jgi:hypothetical protein